MLMSITDDDAMRDFNWREKYEDFDAIEDIEPIVSNPDWCIIRTWKLMPTLRFMQDAWWKIWSMEADDEYISWIRFEKNILTYYKPKQVLTPNQHKNGEH